jgi:hypothetical protein
VAMSTIKFVCPSCGKPEGVPLVYGDAEYLAEEDRAQLDRNAVICVGDAITIDEHCRPMNMACLSCRHEWYSPVDEAGA